MSAIIAKYALATLVAGSLVSPADTLGQDSTARRRARVDASAPAVGKTAGEVRPTQGIASRSTVVLRRVPRLVGALPSDARRMLTEFGFKADSQPAATIVLRRRIPGRVVSQQPPADSIARAGSVVTFYVDTSSRRVPPLDTTLPLVDVPDVVGTPLATALESIKQRGLRATVQPGGTDDVTSTVVRTQSPTPPARVPRGTTVTLTTFVNTTTIVPRLDSMTRSQVIAVLGEAELGHTERVVPSTNVPAGQVVAQTPGGGERVQKRSQVAVTYSDGPPRTAVPNLFNRSREQAESLLAAVSLKAGPVDTVVSTQGVGRVVWQEPPAGSSTGVGSQVRFHIGRLEPQPAIVVPNLMGLTLDSARGRLPPRLRLTLVDSLPSPLPTSTIIAQDPANGQLAQPGADVRVRTGYRPPVDSVTIPSLLNLTRSDAIRAIRDAALVPGREFPADSGSPDRVSFQQPEAGSRDSVGAIIDYWIALPPLERTVIVPEVTGLPLDSARAALAVAQLAGRPVGPRSASESTHWVVLTQEPGGGSRARVGSAVRLTLVHEPPLVVVPAVTGLAVNQARLLLAVSSLGVTVQGSRYALRWSGGTVLTQTPAPGGQLPPGASVTVQLSRALLMPVAWMSVLTLAGAAATVATTRRARTNRRSRGPGENGSAILPVFDVQLETDDNAAPAVVHAPNGDVLGPSVTFELVAGHSDSVVIGVTGSLIQDDEATHG